MSKSPDLAAQTSEPGGSIEELLSRRAQIARMLAREQERHARADSFPVRAEIARHIRFLDQRLAAIDSDLNEQARSGSAREPQRVTTLRLMLTALLIMGR